MNHDSCTVCAEETRGRVWGELLCVSCRMAWSEDEAIRNAERALYPMPTWQMHRAKLEGKPVPELPSAEQSKAVMTNATRDWIDRQRKVVVA